MHDKLYTKIREFHAITQHNNWDLEGAKPVISQMWSDVWDLCKAVRNLGLDDPWITPMTSDTINLTWVLPRGRVISVLFFYDSHKYPWTLLNKDRDTIDSGVVDYRDGLFEKLFELFPVKAKEYREKHKENNHDSVDDE